MATMPVSTNTLGLENPQKPFAVARFGLGTAVLLLLLVRLSYLTPVSFGQVSSVWEIVDWAAIVAAIVAAGWNALVGLRALLAFVVQAGAPAGIQNPEWTVPQLLKERTIEGTYRRPVGLLELLVFRLSPKFAFLTPPNRMPAEGLWKLVAAVLFWMLLLLSLGMGSVWLGVVLSIVMVGRVVALYYGEPEVPNTDHIVEEQIHLGDKGDPVGLYNHVRRSVEQFRVGSFQNRYLKERRPRIAERVEDASVDSELIIETQPMPVPRRTEVPRNALTMDIAGVLVGVLAWGLILFIPVLGKATWDTYAGMCVAAIMGVHFCGDFLRMAFTIHNTFRFQSDVFWIRYDGSYNTTRVGSRDQRTSFQSDLQMFVYGGRIITECNPLGASTHGIQETLTGDRALQTPRYIVNTNRTELFDGRLGFLLKGISEYEDEGDYARTTDLQSLEYQQHFARIQAEALAIEQARVVAWAQQGAPAIGLQPSSAVPKTLTPSPQLVSTSRGLPGPAQVLPTGGSASNSGAATQAKSPVVSGSASINPKSVKTNESATRQQASSGIPAPPPPPPRRPRKKG